MSLLSFVEFIVENNVVFTKTTTTTMDTLPMRCYISWIKIYAVQKKDFKVHLLRKHDFLDFVKINKTISIFHTFYEFDNRNNNSFGHA